MKAGILMSKKAFTFKTHILRKRSTSVFISINKPEDNKDIFNTESTSCKAPAG